MNLLRLLIIAVVVWIAWFLLKRWLAAEEYRKILQKPPKSPELMQQCRYCGVHVPASEVVYDQAVPYCCVEHREAARRSSGR